MRREKKITLKFSLLFLFILFLLMVHCGKLEPFLSFSSPFFSSFLLLILVLTTLVSYLVLPGFFEYLFACVSEVLVRDGMR